MAYYVILRRFWQMKKFATIDMEIELHNVESLSKILARLAKLDDVIEAKRL